MSTVPGARGLRRRLDEPQVHRSREAGLGRGLRRFVHLLLGWGCEPADYEIFGGSSARVCGRPSVLVVRSASSAEFRGRPPLFVGLAAVLAAARPNGSLTPALQSRLDLSADVRFRPPRPLLPGHPDRPRPQSSVNVRRLGYTVGYIHRADSYGG